MRISIIVACLNARPLLLRCLDSIARQDYCDIEVIVADGGSRDGTAEMLRGWQAPSVSSFHWFSGPDAGIADAWNKAITRLSGEWVLFLGADDVLAAPDILSRATARLAELDPATRVAYGQTALVDAQGRQVDLLERPWSPEEFRGCRYNLPHQAAFHHCSLFAELGRLHHVRVLDQRRDARFLEQHLLDARVVAELRQQRLDRDELVETACAPEPRHPDLPHAAAGDLSQKLVAP